EGRALPGGVRRSADRGRTCQHYQLAPWPHGIDIWHGAVDRPSLPQVAGCVCHRGRRSYRHRRRRDRSHRILQPRDGNQHASGFAVDLVDDRFGCLRLATSMMSKRVRRPGVRDGYDAWSTTYDETPNPLVALDRRYTMRLLALTFQIPARILRGTVLVVSPLISLMKDQVDALTRNGFRATVVNSTLDAESRRDRLRRLLAGEYELVYVAPEGLEGSLRGVLGGV